MAPLSRDLALSETELDALLDVAAAEHAEPDLAQVRAGLGRRYDGGHGAPSGDAAPFTATARGRSMRWLVIEPDHVVTWDNRRLGG